MLIAVVRLPQIDLERRTYGSGSVGDAVEGQLGGGRADSGVCGVDLSCVDNGLVLVCSSGDNGGCKSNDGGDGVLHFDG